MQNINDGIRLSERASVPAASAVKALAVAS